MKVLLDALKEWGDYEDIASRLKKEESKVLVSGCQDAQKLHMMHALLGERDLLFVVTHNEMRAREIYDDCQLYGRDVAIYPSKDMIFYQADIHGNKLVKERVHVLRKIMEGKKLTIILGYEALMEKQMKLSYWREKIQHISTHSTVEEKALTYRLLELGYDKVARVETPGQFRVHGGIIDIFDLTEENPYRIELWGDEVESLRRFDVSTQRMIERLDRIVIYPATEMILSEADLAQGITRIQKEAEEVSKALYERFQTEVAHRIKKSVEDLVEQIRFTRALVNLDSYLPYFYSETSSLLSAVKERSCAVVMDEPSRVMDHVQALVLEFRESMQARAEKGYLLPGQMDLLQMPEAVAAQMDKHPLLGLASLDGSKFFLDFDRQYRIDARGIAPYNNHFEMLIKDLQRYKKEGWKVLLLSGSQTRASRLARDLQDQDIHAFYSQNTERALQPGEVMTLYGHAGKGYEYPLLKFAVISETDIFGHKKKKKKKRYEGQKILDYTELRVGDYVVHENHGLGIYRGIEKVEVDKITKDYMKIEYAGGGNLYVLATALGVVQKFAGSDAKSPKLNKLGTQEWNKTKTRVRQAVQTVAKDLVELYAIRQQKQGFVYGRDTVWQREFEELFPYEETDDQLLAIEATKADMESHKIMDRLICGDVGYGKTEIAIRAAFKAVQDGKQVAYLVPTTILAQQHYTTFAQRMKEFPVRVELMSRFRTSAEQKKTIEGLRTGMVDIVIGTHRLLSKDMVYKDLGLLIVDEEQRFGVTHKEKIKKLKDTVDVLTLTATPIPRTLHMSLIGIRDMSVLEEAPLERQPIQTYVMEYNEEMVREAIVREMARGGQVYYVYNRVQNIAEIQAKIAAMVPEARVEHAHGQMHERELEHIMYQFIAGDIDVLVATTIIETGLDIPNVNTMIIHDSDKMGLSQLYQLRGRVGRSSRTSYAFLMYRKDKILQEVAEKRLGAIREFTDLGSGFKIAMRDLEIRGAGNLLGTTQHGHMEAVGYDLYCKMLQEAVKEVKGEATTQEWTTFIDLDVDAYIPDSYIINEIQKLDIYKRIATTEKIGECEDIQDELRDRFGSIPKSVDNLLRIACLRIHAHALSIREIGGKPGELRFYILPSAPIKVDMIPKLLHFYEGGLRLVKGQNPCFILKYPKKGIVEADAQGMMEKAKYFLEDLQQIME